MKAEGALRTMTAKHSAPLTTVITHASRLLYFVFAGCCLLVAPHTATAENFRVNREFGPGSSWQSPRLSNDPVESVEVVVRRLDSRRRSTSLTLQFNDGLTFENGRRMQVDQEYNHTISWDGHNVEPHGRRLVMSVIDGPVYIEEVNVRQSRSYRDDRNDRCSRDRRCNGDRNNHDDRRCSGGGRDRDDDDEDDSRCDGDRRYRR